PTLFEILPHGVRVFGPANRPIAIVIDLNAMWSPGDGDGEIGSQAETDRGAQALWPAFDRTERSFRPVLGENGGSHFSTAGQEARCSIHDRRSNGGVHI